jgi:hypothetical protein
MLLVSTLCAGFLLASYRMTQVSRAGKVEQQRLLLMLLRYIPS